MTRTDANAARQGRHGADRGADRADAMQGDMERCLEAGCNGYAQKPIDRQKLMAVLRQALDQRGD